MLDVTPGVTAPAAPARARDQVRRVGRDPRDERLVLDRVDMLERADEWNELARRSGALFGTVEWLSAWRRHLGSGPTLDLAVRRPDGTLVGVAPLYVDRRLRAGVLRFQGGGPGDQLGPLCAPADRARVGAVLRRALAGRVVLAERLPVEQGWGGLLGGRRVRLEPSPILRTRARSWEEFLESRSANFRGQVRGRERRLRRSGRLRFRLTADPALLPRDLDLLFALHDARWPNGESRAFAGRRADFHRAFAAAALDRGWLRLWFLELDGRPVAAWYGFRFGGAEHFYQSGRDPRLERDAVGFVLLAHTIRAAIDDGVREYRLLRGHEAYKQRFATEDRGVETVVLGPGPTAAAAAGAGRLLLSLPSRLTRPLTRRVAP